MKKTFLVVFIGALLVSTLGACGGGNNNSDVHDSEWSAEQLYGQSCASCHGMDLREGYAPDLDKIGSKYSSEEIEEIILNGKGSMPKGFLKGKDAKKVADWLATHK